ncbi:MAG: hypothetical protein PWP27_1108 [Clostridiales bacterium]|jgi:uncharacterized membrane protein|nr:hypothetical protein [Clostridiales bacterium]MDK2933298.1 hypothetical protein [Clostridiales bacterium]
MRTRISSKYCSKKILLSFTLTFLILIFQAVSVPFSTEMNAVQAQDVLTISTPYSGITVKAGETVEFPLDIENSGMSSQNINLSVKSIPEGWEGSFEGRGKKVHQIFVKNKNSQSVDLKIQIPSETPEGNYQVIVAASGKSVSDTLTLDLKVKKETESQGKLIAQYPELQGAGGASFKFRVDLTNNRSKDQSYSLGAKVPRGWEVSFSPSYENKKIASISLEPDKSQGLDVEIRPPEQVKAGKYTIPITAVSPNEQLSTELKVVITGTYDINLTTPTGRLNVESYAGKEKVTTLIVENNGSADLKDVKFSSWEPTNWSVTFEPEQLDVLPAGESKEIKAYIKPDNKAIAGDYVVKLTASTPETSSDIELRTMVKTSTVWGIVGILIIVLLIAGLSWTFKKYGRR